MHNGILLDLFSFYFIYAVVLAILGYEVTKNTFDDGELGLAPVVNGSEQNFFFMVLVTKPLPPYFHGTLRFACVTSHEIVSELLIGLVSMHYSRPLKLILLLLNMRLLLRQYLLPLHVLHRIKVLVVRQVLLRRAIRVLLPDVDGAQFHVLVHAGEHLLPVAFGALVPVVIEDEGVEDLGFRLHV